MSREPRFKYRPPTKQGLKDRANQQGGQFDSVFKDGLPTWSPKEGDHQIRILPATWDDSEHYGFDIFVHYGIGADNQQYLCRHKMLDEKCCIDEERRKAERSGDGDYASELKPTKRVVVWIIDRDAEAEGPQLYAMPWTMDRDITALAVSKKNKEALLIDHPDEGFDVLFSRKGAGMKTKYIGLSIDREATPIHNKQSRQDEWLDYIAEHPIPKCLRYYDDEYIAGVFAGGASKAKDEDGDEDEPRSRRSRRGKEEAPRSRRSRGDDEDEPKKRRSRDEEEEEAPKRRSRDEDEDEPKSRRKQVDDPDEELDEDKYEKHHRNRDEDEEEKPKPRSGRQHLDDEDEPKKRRSRDDEEDEPAAKRRSRDDEEDEPRRRKPREEDEDEPKRRRSRDDEDEEPRRERRSER